MNKKKKKKRIGSENSDLPCLICNRINHLPEICEPKLCSWKIQILKWNPRIQDCLGQFSLELPWGLPALMWVVQTFGGVLCVVLGQLSSLGTSVAVMIALLVQAACRLAFGVVPFVSRRAKRVDDSQPST